MRKFLFTLACILLGVNAIEAQRTMHLKTLAETKGIEKSIPTRDVELKQNGVTVTYRFNNIILQDDPLYKSATTIKIDGFWPNCSVGKPAVLSRWDTFVIPNASAKIVVKDSSYVEIPMELSPARPVLSNSGNEIFTTDNVKPITEYSGLFPFSLISATRNDSYRGQKLLDVCVTPVQYDFANKKVRVFTMVQYDVQYNAVALKNSLSRSSKERMNGNSFLNNIALNFPSPELPHNPKAATSSAENISSKYLIISVPKYSTAVNRFAEWKRTLGFNVQIAMNETWDTTMVKNVVSQAYNSDSIEYLLIVGGQNDIPALIRNEIYNYDNHLHPTDLYYACMDNGYTPDIFRGRLLVNTSDEAFAVIDKIINYEKNPITDGAFYNTGIHCAYFQDYNEDQKEDRRFVLTSEEIRNRMLSVISNIHRVYCTENSNINPKYWNDDSFANGEEIPTELQRPAFAWDGNRTNIRNYIDQKAFYVFLRDHGMYTYMSKPFFHNTDIIELNNGRYLPIVFSICCLTGKFTTTNCFCERFLKKENGGCVAIFGATENSISGPNDVLAEGMFDAIWPSPNLLPSFGIVNDTAYTETPIPTYRLGQILDQGLKRCDEAYLGTRKAWYSRYTHQLFHCFGDPSMMICTSTPTVFSGASINRQNGTIYVNTGGEIANISFYNRRTGIIESYRDSSQTHVDDPEISICISGHNKIPYIDGGTLYIQNQTLTNNSFFDANTIKVGSSVTTTHPQGDVNFNQGNHMLVGKEIELHPGTIISLGTTVEIKKQ